MWTTYQLYSTELHYAADQAKLILKQIYPLSRDISYLNYINPFYRKVLSSEIIALVLTGIYVWR